jgi:hypothetical protein
MAEVMRADVLPLSVFHINDAVDAHSFYMQDLLNRKQVIYAIVIDNDVAGILHWLAGFGFRLLIEECCDCSKGTSPARLFVGHFFSKLTFQKPAAIIFGCSK